MPAPAAVSAPPSPRRWPTRAPRCSSPTSTAMRPPRWPNAFDAAGGKADSCALDVARPRRRRRRRRAGRRPRRGRAAHPRQQRRRHAPAMFPKLTDETFRLIVRHPRDGHVPLHPGRAAVHADRRHGPHHQRHLGGRAHRHARAGQLLGGQGRHHRLHQVARARAGAPRTSWSMRSRRWPPHR